MTEESTQEEIFVGRLTSKTITHTVTVLFEGAIIERNKNLVVFANFDKLVSI